MPATERELNHFTQFARIRLAAGENRLSLDELFDLWRSENRSDADRATNVAAINASIRDFQQGERGILAGEDSAALRRAYGIEDE